MAAAAEDDSVTDAQDRIRAEVEVGHQPGGQGDLFADDAVRPEVDPGFPEDRAEREGQPGAGAERAEAEPSRVGGGDGAGALHPGPARVHGPLRQAARP